MGCRANRASSACLSCSHLVQGLEQPLPGLPDHEELEFLGEAFIPEPIREGVSLNFLPDPSSYPYSLLSPSHCERGNWDYPVTGPTSKETHVLLQPWAFCSLT